VEDALTMLHAEQQRRKLVEEAVQQWLRIADNADLLGNAGLQSGPQRAATLRQALAGYSAALAVRHAHASSWVRLYRALGGGWTT
jgi:outer membrane protein, multidrug efflux system